VPRGDSQYNVLYTATTLHGIRARNEDIWWDSI